LAGSGEIIADAFDLSRPSTMQSDTVAIDPETAKWRTIANNLPGGPVSPDGRYVVYSQHGNDHDEAELGIWVYDLTGEARPRRIFERNGEPYWSDNGQRVVIAVPVGTGYKTFETWRVNADGTQRVRLPIPESDLVLDCSRDGTWLATRTIGGEPAARGRLRLVHPDGSGARHLTEWLAKISPDGRSVACVEVTSENRVLHSRLFVIDIETKAKREIPAPFEPGSTVAPYWSPDGSMLAVNAINNRTKEGSVVLVKRDGTDLRALPLPPGKWYINVCDWKALTPALRVADLKKLQIDPKTPRGRYEALLEEVHEAKPFQPKLYVGRFLEIAESDPADRAAIDAWIWIITFGFEGPEFERAIDRLAEHADTIKVGRAALAANEASPSSEKLLRAVVEKNDSHPLKGRACLALGRYLKRQSDQVRSIKNDPEEARRWEARFLELGFGKEGFTRLVEKDPDLLMQEAESVLERTAREFSDVRNRGDSTLADEARAELFEIRNLRPGRPAPEITGADVDGKPFALSDARGKVVVVSFWAEWCASCRDMIQYEKSLVEGMRGRPFVLLGVNAGEDKAKVRELISKDGIAWRSWWDGGGNANTVGPIARKYNVDTWPTLYVVDHHGVIRRRFIGSPDRKTLDSVIDGLVKTAEEADAAKKDRPD
jgi:thiol-disulfide isomerase/thioredoxin